MCDEQPEYVRGRCLHREVVPVESIVTGEVVARLCLTCDTQLPAEWCPGSGGSVYWYEGPQFGSHLIEERCEVCGGWHES